MEVVHKYGVNDSFPFPNVCTILKIKVCFGIYGSVKNIHGTFSSHKMFFIADKTSLDCSNVPHT